MNQLNGTCFLLSAITFLFASGCSQPPPPLRPQLQVKIGQPCVVQFRRDALGAAAPNPIPPTTGNFNGAQTSMLGSLVAANDLWVAIEVEEYEYWIPREAILSLRVAHAANGKRGGSGKPSAAR